MIAARGWWIWAVVPAGRGLYLARETGASLIGVDLSSVAIGIAANRAEKLGLAGVARFQNGSFTYTGLPDAPADAAVSLDALQYTPDIGAAFREVARLLRPGGRLAFTAFELDAVAVAGLPGVGTAPAEDFRPALEGAPLAIRVYKETQGWSERVYAAFSAVAGAQGVLREEMGPVAIAALMSEVTAVLERRIYKRGVYCLAQRV